MGTSNDEVCFYKRLVLPDTVNMMEGPEALYGPDQIIPTTNISTTEPDGAIRIRYGETEASKLTPESIPGLLARTVALHPNQPALAYKKYESEQGFHFITYREYYKLVRTAAKAFIKLGLEPFHSVAIIGFNSPPWHISYLAAIHAGGFATGIYTTNSPEACHYCLSNGRANIVVAENEAYVDKILKHKQDLPNLKKIIQYEGEPTSKDVISWNEFLSIGRDESDAALENVLRRIAINQCASIVYTSGTVGSPKAAMLSHDNLIFDAKAGIASLELGPDETIISYLPLSHVAAQIIDIMCPLVIAGTVYFANKDALKGGLIKTLVEVRPTRFLGVPRVWEKIAEKMRTIGAQAGTIKKIIAAWAKNQGMQRYLDLMKGIDDPRFGYLVARALIFSKIKKNLGFDRCKLFLTGAAPLSSDIKSYFASLDIPIMDVFGMTECSGAHTVNIPTAFRLESIGRTIPGFKTKIHSPDQDGQGEICMYGRHVFMGYLNDRPKTDEAIDSEGWLHSGDLGKIEEMGYVYITGRIKEILITAGGENIPPVLIEQNIKVELPCIGQAVVIGDKKKFLSVLLTLSCEIHPDTGEPLDELTELSKTWLKEVGCPFNKISEVIASGPDKKIIKAIQSAIDAANEKAISNAQKVQKFALLSSDFSVTTGELGPTMKLRRNIVNSKYKDVIDKLYQN